MELEDFVKKYSSLEKKYKLPKFGELDEFFEIHKSDKEGDFVLRNIRKQMMEKIVNSLGFVEMFLTGMNAPRMYYAYLKSMTEVDKKKLDKIFKEFAELIVMSLELEIEHDEKGEVELIKETLKVWKDNKKDFKEVLGHIRKPSGSDGKKKERNYFG